MVLPNLDNYRSVLLSNNLQLPLSIIKSPPNGLLNELPPPASDQLTGWPWTVQTSPAIYGKRKIWPKLTIVTPSYNQAVFLEQTIRAVLLQNYPNLEFIIMDGGSTDGSVEILEKYAPWISYRQSQKDEGQAQAINMGFSISSGEYMAWINSDDYYLPNVFYTVIQTFLKHRTDFVYGHSQGYHIDTNKMDPLMVPPLMDYFIKIPSLAQPSCFWRASIHQPLWEEMHCALDYELWLRMVRGKKRHRIRKMLSVAHVHGNAKTADPAMQERWHQDHVKMWSAEGHGPVPEWKRIVFLNRIRMKIYKITGWL